MIRTVLEQQTRRMLADPRARSALVANFFSQWLQARNVWLLTPDSNRRFPWFDDNLRTAFVRELELFLESQLQEDRSILDLLTADYTFLNEQLARHYGIPGIYGSHFQTSEAHRSEPVGTAWQSEHTCSDLVSTSNVADHSRQMAAREHLGCSRSTSTTGCGHDSRRRGTAAKASSIREMLERHRANPACASCHARMDPLGFALENFDASRAMAHKRWHTHRSTRPAFCSMAPA